MGGYRIGIIGCGVGGCAAAIQLRRLGHAVTLFEQSSQVGPVGAGVLLQTSGQRVLRAMGLLDAVLATAEPIDELIAHTHRGRLLSRLRFADRPSGEQAYGLHRGDLFTVLHAALIACGVDLKLDHTIQNIRGDTLYPANGQPIGPFDLIVIADGSRSHLRAASGLPAFVHHYGPAALWAIGSGVDISRQLVQRARHTHQLCGLLPTGGGRCSFFWGLNAADWPTVRYRPFEEWRRDVVELMPLAEPLLRPMTGFGDLTFVTYRAVWMPRVTRGRCVFIGDAAHASSPLLGHGINLALCDATQLSAAVAESRNIESALEQYDDRQRWRNAYYSGLSAALSPSFQGNSRFIGVARDFVLPRLQKIAPLRSIMLRTLSGVWS